MQTWTTDDKSKWGPGPWQDEPDKTQWIDEATGLPCMTRRGGSGGHWCGYVGVPVGHPLHRLDYDTAYERAGIEAHGGLTFADACHEPTEAEWRTIRDEMESPKLLAEVARYPRGDAARRLASLREQVGLSFAEWRDWQMARRICHVPERPEHRGVWWFGFDCAHCDDLSPGSDRSWSFGNGVYQDLRYVQDECRSLARQLAAVVADA